ncbi:MAG: serine/threonine protein kinase [Myxococcales bacterium]|nr:serine/threonine protein kinase [Myxococcales bacterium]
MNPRELVGRTLGHKFLLEAMIGRGGFGAVYRASQLPLGRMVAVKVNLHLRHGALRTRFVREARVLSELRHPGCVMLLDFGEEPDGLFYMVQEYVFGRSLGRILAAEGTVCPERATGITAQILDALQAAHQRGIIHRDIKPGNVMLAERVDGRSR